MTRKTYQSIHYIELDTYIMVGGHRKLIQFRGGSLKPRINGRYTTSDPAEVEVLDKDAKRPGASFKCVYSEEIPERTFNIEVKSEATQPEPEEFKDQSEDISAQSMGVKSVPEINTVQEARKYLAANVEGLTLSKLPNATAVKSAAAKNNIVFPNLP
jgi:hypothetical protein